MTDELRALIELDVNGHGAVTIGGTARRLEGPDLTTARDHAKSWVIEHARMTGQPIALTVSEPGRDIALRVTADGAITDAPQENATPAVAPSPASGDLGAIETAPATEGWRGTMNALGMRLAPGAAELEKRRTEYAAHQEQETRAQERRRRAADAERADRELIQTTFPGPRTILIANPKGGARKTTTAYCLAATWGITRGGSIVAWDANETMGTLGERSRQNRHQRTVVDLLTARDDFASAETARLGALDGFVRAQGDSHFDVLASDENPVSQDMVDAHGFAAVHDILARFYRVIFVDTGNNIRASHFLAARDIADQLVIPVAAARDSADAATKMMGAFRAAGHGDLVESAVVLLHEVTPTDPAAVGIAQQIAAELAPQVSAVHPIPFDAALKDGQQIDYATLAPQTRLAYRQAAAAIAAAMIRTDEAKAASA